MNDIYSWWVEVDFLAVGDTQSGDAVCVRLGNCRRGQSCQYVIVIDGGFKGDGDRVVSHLGEYYHTDEIDLLISSHPHQDHNQGMLEIVDKCRVKEFAIHQPWTHVGLADLFEDKRATCKSIKGRLSTHLAISRKLVQLAGEKGVGCVFEPFAGKNMRFNILGFRVVLLSPSEEFYDFCLRYFACTPDEKSWPNATRLKYNNKEVLYECCRLTDDGATSAENNASTVLLIICPDGQQLLFTADAGMPALYESITQASALEIRLNQLSFFQVPHHGSIQNIGPLALSCLSPCLGLGKDGYAAVSVASSPDNEHPALSVLNAVKEKGFDVYETHGTNILFPFGNYPLRNWKTAKPFAGSRMVQEFVS